MLSLNVMPVNCQTKKCKGVLFTVQCSKLEESMGHQVFECDVCHRRWKLLTDGTISEQQVEVVCTCGSLNMAIKNDLVQKLSKWERIKAGERVVCSSKELDTIEAMDDPLVDYVASLPNPKRLGTKDTWVVFLKNPPKAENLFTGIYPAGIVYSDRSKEVNGDYKRIAFLPYRSLVLEVADKRSPLLPLVVADAAKIQARRGELFEVSSCGQTVKLGE